MAQFPRLSLFMIALSASCLSQSQSPVRLSEITEKAVPALHIEQFEALNALAQISRDAKVPIGFQERVPQKQQNFVLDFQGGTVADLLNAFVSKYPQYSWRENADHVVRVFAKQENPSLTDVALAYSGAIGKTRREIWQDITKIPEVEAWMASTHCSREQFFIGHESGSHNDPITIDSGSMTVAQLLDAVAVKSGANYWAIVQSPRGEPCRFSIFIE